jgi:hypothetical protein
MIVVTESQSLIDIAIQQTGSALAVFDYSVLNEVSITDVLIAGNHIKEVPQKEYESFNFEDIIKKYINPRSLEINVIQSQSLLDIAIQTDGCVLAVFDYAIANGISITDGLDPGRKLKMPISDEFRYNDLANYFKSTNRMIATYQQEPTNILEYLFPGEFPFSF